MTETPEIPQKTPDCVHCHKPEALCVCEFLTEIPTKRKVLILQHPQEQDKILGTAWILHKMLPKSIFKIGLSWPSLSRALGQEADARQWGVLYLGTVAKSGDSIQAPLTAVDINGKPLADQEDVLKSLYGIIVLDGTWEQAKTLWWRNAWLLKAKRLVLHSDKPSLYGKLRREPRKGSLSTLESTALALSVLENKADLFDALTVPMAALMSKCESEMPAKTTAAPRPFRRRRPFKAKK